MTGTSLIPSTTPSPALKRGWWLFLVRGVLALALGCFALLAPAATLGAVVILLGVFFIIDGAFAVYKAFDVVRVHASSWWLLLVAGLVGIVVGVAVFRWPGLTLLTLGYLVGFWAILTGVLEIGVATALRKTIRGEWFYVIFGIISIVFGALVIFAPGLGLAYLTFMIAFYGFVAGIALITLAFRLRNLRA